ncbi:DUF433 domain-containing protein [Candidatus Pacearchaeota archaeon]|nr:DUF433 domain-containing protein [Candidatus Pacearchaeota archaeon]
MKKILYKNIVVDYNVMVGKPVIDGTRIPIDLIIELMAQGTTTNEILEDYPNLKKEDIITVLEYVAKVVRGESILPVS